jgi:cytochrome P450
MSATMTSLDEDLGRLFDSDPAAMADPAAVYRRLHLEGDRFHRYESSILFSRYDDVRTLKSNSLDWIGAIGVARESAHAKAYVAQLAPEHREAMQAVADFEDLFMSRTGNHERWARLRRIAHRAFTPRRIDAMQVEIERNQDELLEAVAGAEVCDLAEFCYRLPLMVIASMLGVPVADHELVHAWTAKLARSTWRDPSKPETLHAAVTAMDEFRGYVDEIVEQHRSDPGSVSPLVAAMLDAEEEERATPDELTAMFVNFLFAGHETTSNLFSIGLAELLRNREQYELLAGRPELASDATEELLRYVSPAQFAPCDIRADFVLDGFEVHRHDTVMIMGAAANRDPLMFPEPDRLDITRPNAKEHLAFGFGPRYCLGQALARLEAHAVFSTVPSRFPEMTLATDELEWHGVAMLRRLVALPVRPGRVAA